MLADYWSEDLKEEDTRRAGAEEGVLRHISKKRYGKM
jgi:hypothetical protein